MATETSSATKKDYINCFLESIADSSETVYLVFFGIYVATSLILKVSWNLPWPNVIWFLRVGMTSAVLWGGTVYLFGILFKFCQKMDLKIFLIPIGIVMMVIVTLFSRSMSQNAFNIVMDIFFCCMAYKKNYKNILRVALIISLSTLAIGTIGVAAGFTKDILIYKPNRIDAVHSFGSIYPNTWGYIAFLIVLITWYLYFRDRMVFLIIFFWIFAWFMYGVLSCKTISLLSAVFPFLSILTGKLEKKGDENNRILSRIGGGVFTFFPIIMFGFTMFLCWQMDWIQKHFYSTRLLSLAMRFVEGGYALRQNEIQLWGHELYFSQDFGVSYQDQITNFIDSPFVAYLITRGILWMIICLVWLVYANKKCMEIRDYRLLAISTCMMVLAIMERPALDVWYNFVLLFPLSVSINRGNRGNSNDQTKSGISKPAECIG